MQLTLGELAQKLNATLVGDANTLITSVQTLEQAKAGSVSFLANPAYRSQLAGTKASAVIVAQEVAEEVSCAALIVKDPYLSFALTTQLFDNRPKPSFSIHPSAIIADTAKLGENVSVGPNVVIGEHCLVGDRVEIGANTVIGDNCAIGNDCHLNANVTFYHGVILGDRVRVHSGTVLGADGFGFAPNHGQWVKIAQLGGVRIGNDVDIGANTCIDRGALDDTVIDDDVILDNLIQLAHNVKIGTGTAIAACTGISGSTNVGKNCIIAGGVGMAGHLEIADGVHITGMGMITHSIKEPGVYSSGIPQMPSKDWRKNAVRFRQLDELVRRFNRLEREINDK